MEHFPYEGAGFLLSFQDKVILGQRIKKASDLAKDPTIELEYMGGKVDVEDCNDPYRTAYAELVEELGMNVLESNWHDRVKVVHIFQPFSKHWIWCFCLELTAQEYDRVQEACQQLLEWPENETRSFDGRGTPARKSIQRLVAIPKDGFQAHLDAFRAFPDQNNGNRMKDAKDFREVSRLSGKDILTGELVEHPLRAFNAVMFEKNLY